MDKLSDSSSLLECTTSPGDYNLLNPLFTSEKAELTVSGLYDRSRCKWPLVATLDGPKSGHGWPRKPIHLQGYLALFGATRLPSKSDGMRENLLTKREAASLLNVSVRTIERYIFEHKLMS
jgi:hypothetical protein